MSKALKPSAPGALHHQDTLMWHHLRQPAVRVLIISAGVLLSKALSFGHTSTFIYIQQREIRRLSANWITVIIIFIRSLRSLRAGPGRAEVREQTSPLSEGWRVEREEPEDACRQETTRLLINIHIHHLTVHRTGTNRNQTEHWVSQRSLKQQIFCWSKILK